MSIGKFNLDEQGKRLPTSESNGVVISTFGKVRLMARALLLILIQLLVLTVSARSDIVAPATINGAYPLATSNIGGSTANTANTGTLTGLGQNGPYNFSVTASIVRLNAATSPIAWNAGLRFTNATTLQFQPIRTIYGPSTANGQLGYASYDIVFNNPVLGLTFNWAGIDFGDNIEVFAYNGATAVPILSSYYVINGAQKTAYTPRVDRFNAASGLDTNAAGIQSIDATTAPNTGNGAPTSVTFTFPTDVKVSRIFVRAGKITNSTNETVNATTQISSMAWNVETVKIQKTSVGGTGTFGFSSVSNLASTPASILTATPDVAAPAAPTSIRFSAINSNLSVTESATAGYTLTGFVCTDANSAVSGNPATFGTFVSATRVGTIPAANAVTGANITCQFTNTRTAVRVQKISLGGTGTFGFTSQSNLASTPVSILTSTAGVAAPATPPIVPSINVTTVGTAVTMTEAAVAGYSLTGFTCSDANAAITGNPASFGTFVSATRVGTIPAANIVVGADITCVFTNTKSPTLSLTKTLGGNRVAAGDQFTVALRTGGVSGTVENVTTNSTTTGATNVVTGGTGTTGTFTAIAGTAYTLTEAASGTTNFAQYTSAITCTDSAGLQTGLPSGAAYTVATGLTITPVAGAVISCTLTNTAKAPTLELSKALSGNRVANTDQFAMALRTGGVAGTVVNVVTNATTTGTGSTVTGGTGTTGTFTATAGTAYTLTEGASGTTNFAQYNTRLVCSDSAGLQTGLPTGGIPFDTAVGYVVTPVAGAAITCSLINSAKAPTLAMTKALGGNRVADTDQFTLALKTGGVSGTVVNVTTNSTTTGVTNVVTGGTGTTGTFAATAGTAYTLTEAASGTTNLAQYTSAITCTDSAGLQTGLPSGAAYTVATGLNITPLAGAVISCTLTNTAKAPTLELSKALGSNRVAATDQFTLALRTGGIAGTVVNVTTNSTTTGATNVVTGGTGTTGTFTAIAGTAYTLTEAASGTTNFAQYTSAISCTDSASLQTGLPSGAAYTVATGLTITPVAGAVISCTLTNTANNPVLTLAKSVVNTGGGTAVASDWTLQASGPTAISGVTGAPSVTAATVTAGAYTLSETGGPADINGGAADYSASTNSCVVNGGAAVSGNSITLNLGDTTVCTITNTFAADPTLTIDKRLLTGTTLPLVANQVITYEFEVTNTGNVPVTDLNIEETAFTGTGTIGAFTPPNGTVDLAPGASTIVTATYTVSQADVDLLQ